MKTIQYIFLTFAAISLTFPICAQTGSSQLEREMTLEREYNPSLRDANKINQLPQVKEPEAPKTNVEFSNFLLDYNIPPYLSTLKAQSYFSDYATTKNRGYLNMGVSSLLNIDGDFGYQILNSDKDYLSFYVSHRSSNSDVNYLQNNKKQKMKINDNVGGVNYNHNFNKFKFLADAQYIYSGFNYYGINRPLNDQITGDSFLKNNTNQVNNIFQTKLGIQSLNNEALSYKANVHYIFFNQKYSLYKEIDGKRENRFGADFDVSSYLNSMLGLGLGGYVKYSQNDIPFYYDDKLNYTILSLNPNFFFQGDNWNIRLGISANMQTQTRESDKYTFAPDVKINFRPSEAFLIYIQATGGIEDNNNYNMFLENRYIDPRYRIKDSRIPLDGLLGVNFSLIPELSIDLFTGYKISKDEHFLCNYGYSAEQDNLTPIIGETLSPFYEKAQIFKLGGAVKYAYQDIFDIGVKLTYYNWDIKKDNYSYNDQNFSRGAWNKPEFIADVLMGFKVPTIPLRMDINYHLETGRKACLLSNTNQIANIKNIHALNAKVNYEMNNSFSIFAQANNLLFQKYDIWYGYPAQKFNIMGGLSVKF